LSTILGCPQTLRNGSREKRYGSGRTSLEINLLFQYFFPSSDFDTAAEKLDEMWVGRPIYKKTVWYPNYKENPIWWWGVVI